MSANIRALIFSVLLVLIGWTAGYFEGKRAADRYYAPKGTEYKCIGVTLIDPIRWRAPEPVASMEPK